MSRAPQADGIAKTPMIAGGAVGEKWADSAEDVSRLGRLRLVFLRMGRPARLLALVCTVLWLAAAELAYLWASRDPHNCIGPADLAMPWRWSRLRELRGEALLASGRAGLESGRVEAGLFEIWQGLARHPDDAGTRLAAAKVLADRGHYAGVRQLMLPQLQLTPPPPEFIRFLMAVAAQHEDHAAMLAASECSLRAPDCPGDERGWLLECKAAGLAGLGRRDEALAALDLAGRNRSLEWRHLRTDLLLAAGRATEAVAEIEGWSGENLPPKFRLHLLAEACARAGRRDEMERSLRELVRLYPATPEPWLEAASRYAQAGWRDAAWTTLRDCLWRFEGDSAAVAAIEWTCAQTGYPELSALCVENARELGRPVFVPLADLMVAQLKAGDLVAARRTHQQLLAEEQAARSGQRGWAERGWLTDGPQRPVEIGGRMGLPPQVYQWLGTLLEAASQPADQAAEAHLSVLARGGLRLTAHRTSVEVLANAGRWAAVEGVARVGLVHYPGSTRLLRWRAHAAHLRAGLQPVEPISERARDRVGEVGQEEFFAGLDAAFGRKDWSAAETMIRAVRFEPPSWLDRNEAELAWREVRVEFEQDNRGLVLFLVGERIRSHKEEGVRALSVARDYLSRGDSGMARRLAALVVQELPSSGAARELLATLEAPPAS